MITISFLFNIIEDISNSDRQFLEAMNKLKEDGIIDCQSCMLQFRTQFKQQEFGEQQTKHKSSNTPKCSTWKAQIK